MVSTNRRPLVKLAEDLAVNEGISPRSAVSHYAYYARSHIEHNYATLRVNEATHVTIPRVCTIETTKPHRRFRREDPWLKTQP